MVGEVLQSVYRRTMWSLVLRGLLAIAIGLFILMRPLDSVATLALVIAIWALFSGIVQIVHAFELRTVLNHWWVMLLSGIIGVLFGLAAFYYYPLLSLTFAVVWVTWWLFLTGALAIYASVQERRANVSWGWTLVAGVAAIVTGVLALAHPPATLAAILGLIAGFAIVSGVALLIGAFRLSSAKGELADRVRGAAAG